MSKGGGTNTVTQQANLPDWVQAAAQNNLSSAAKVANNLMLPYSGPTVAGLNPAQIANISASLSVCHNRDPTGRLANAGSFSVLKILIS